MSKTPRVSDIYRHFKGNLYQIVAIAEHSETREQMVVYQALYGDFRIYARPLDMFLEPVDKVKYPDATQRMRFELVDREKLQQAVSQPVELHTASTKPTAPVPAPTAFASSKVAPDAPVYSDEVLEQVEPGVLRFLDADTHEQRLEILVSLAGEITDHMLNTMAVAMDVELSEETLEDKYEELKSCLITLEKYERNRLY
ncbi:MAG: DUF1653 domain-containing protein [Lachnospiraceae bacterium]|nr:DUF1653 domain-containing protein [Lachnospiraceae bacterium]